MGRTQGLHQVNPTCRKLPESLKHSSKFPFPFLLQPLGWDWARWGDLGEWGIGDEINMEEVSTIYQPFFPGKHTCVPQEMTKTQIKEKLYYFQPIFPFPNFLPSVSRVQVPTAAFQDAATTFPPPLWRQVTFWTWSRPPSGDLEDWVRKGGQHQLFTCIWIFQIYNKSCSSCGGNKKDPVGMKEIWGVRKVS